MDIQRWLARQEPEWQRFETLLNKAEGSNLKQLSGQEIQQLSGLYRLVSADLARAKARQVGVGVIDQLKQLTLRGYAQIYQGGRRQAWRSVWEFIVWGFPAITQETAVYSAIATLVFLAGSGIGWWYTWQDPVFMNLVIPSEIINLVQEKGELWMGSIVGVEPLASSAIMRNNISVTFSTFAGGALAGLPTLYILWNNGIHIGAIATLVGQNKLAYPFWAFVMPHGALELPAIFLAGGAGLLVARGIVFPGRYQRLVSLKIYAGKAIQLMFGVVPMLVIAGVIEGFFSPSPQVPAPLKYLVGISLLWALLLYLSRRFSPPAFLPREEERTLG
ncbi:MAG: stage II sporulation protein M [Acaryochloridaceae cyanobacterium SU_2_1]|nr:stage II sporulation protein M [Acaryochloridaceae cyanobacterium SU_2_1]NJM95508.1 stage II sporulation protein M [Acaryochloridaceae cyanobacterium CSU_5_19]